MTDPTPPPDDPRPTGETDDLADWLRALSHVADSHHVSLITEAADRLDALEARVAQLEREQAALIEAWPGRLGACVYQRSQSSLWDGYYDTAGYPTKAVAVRAKAGLGEEGETT